MTSTGSIGPNDTIADVISKLKSPIPYMRGVLDKLAACESLHGNAFVRIGITGTGLYPCYRVSYVSDGTEQVFAVYNDNGTLFVSSELNTDDWSGKSMSRKEVEHLAAKLGL